jgi:hypothetical protein
VARCTAARPMREFGLRGAVRGKKIITVIQDTDAHLAGDLIERDFTAPAPTADGSPTVPTWRRSRKYQAVKPKCW